MPSGTSLAGFHHRWELCNPFDRLVMERPVLYLDLDDTVISWAGGEPRAAPGAHEFLSWALEHCEVRWLTTWCPTGTMDEKLLADLASLTGIPTSVLRRVRGGDWEGTQSKLNGIAWVEHVVLGRPFMWIEDEYGFRAHERFFLEQHHLLGSYLHCNVTEDGHALARAFSHLRRWASDLAVAA